MGFNSILPTRPGTTTKSSLELMISRADFVSFLSFAALIPSVSNAFDGGVGGLGKCDNTQLIILFSFFLTVFGMSLATCGALTTQ